MSDDQTALDPDGGRQGLRARLYRLFEETGDRCYLDAARVLSKPSDELSREDILFADDTPTKNPAHRPPIDDDDVLMEMGRLVVGEGYTENRASHRIAETIPTGERGASKETIAERLRRKFRKDRRGRQEYSRIWQWSAGLKPGKAEHYVTFQDMMDSLHDMTDYWGRVRRGEVRHPAQDIMDSLHDMTDYWGRVRRGEVRHPAQDMMDSLHDMTDYLERVRRREVPNPAQDMMDSLHDMTDYLERVRRREVPNPAQDKMDCTRKLRRAGRRD